MRHRSSTLPTLTVCLLLATVVIGLRAEGDQASAQERPHVMASLPAALWQPASRAGDPLGANWERELAYPSGPGIPRYADPEFLLLVRDEGTVGYEPFLTAADLSGDGLEDLILGDASDDIANEYSTARSEVLQNDGSGRFTWLPGALPPKDNSPFDIAHDIEALHLDSDSHIDLLMVYERANSQGSYIQVLHNNGDGTFRSKTAARLEPLARRVWIRKLELRDLDRDGDADLLAYPWDDRDPDPILWVNNGAGSFGLVDFDFKMRSPILCLPRHGRRWRS